MFVIVDAFSNRATICVRVDKLPRGVESAQLVDSRLWSPFRDDASRESTKPFIAILIYLYVSLYLIYSIILISFLSATLILLDAALIFAEVTLILLDATLILLDAALILLNAKKNSQKKKWAGGSVY